MNRTPNSADAAPAPPAALFEAILARAPIGFALIDRSFRYLWVNDAFLDIYELPAEPLIGKRVQDVIPSLWPEIEPRYERVLRGESISSLDVTATLSVHGGPPRHFIVSHFPVRISGEIVGIGVIINDVSEREEAREALAVRNNLYAMLAHTNRAVSQSRTTGELFDAICRIAVTAGKFTCAWIGVRDGTVVRQVARAGEDQGYLDALVISLEPTDPRSQGPTGQSFLTGRPWVVNDFVASAATKPWHEAARRVGFGASATFPLFERGQVVAVLTVYAGEAGFFTDDLVSALNEITPSVSFALNRFADERDREREQEALRLRDRAIQAAAQGIIIADTRGEDNPLVYASPGFERIMGYTAAEVLGHNVRLLVGERTDMEEVARLSRDARLNRPTSVELCLARKDGSDVWVELSVTPVHDDGGSVTHLVGVMTDITERRRMEEQYRQSQKMEAIGLLAGGVAHDFNNLLTIINGYSDLASLSLADDDPLQESLREIRHAGERAAGLTRQLLAFSRRQVLDPQIVNVNTAVTDTERMLRRVIGEDVELVTRLEAPNPEVKVDPGQLSQVILNLAVNARDAMPRGGRLTIATANVMLDDALVRARPGATPGPAVALSVQDTGVGMDAATRARIFEPFFTTKPTGKGTGLGLPTVLGIVEQSHGYLAVESEVGKGSTFTIYLPVASEAPGVADGHVDTTALPRGTETILLVEDDAAVRQITQRILESCGYTVLAAEDGEEAERACWSHRGPVHLLLSDVILPGTSGRQLAESVVEAHPECKVLLVSGYTDDRLVQHGLDSQRISFLQKPYSPIALAIRVRSVLGDARAPAVEA